MRLTAAAAAIGCGSWEEEEGEGVKATWWGLTLSGVAEGVVCVLVDSGDCGIVGGW